MQEVNVKFSGSIMVGASPEAVFSVLSDVPDSVSHFPGLESLAAEAGGYRWILLATGPKKYAVQMDYACRYESNPDSLEVWWTAIEGIGNSHVNGGWTIAREGEKTRVSIRNDLVITLKLPVLLRKPAQTIVAKKNRQLLEGYLVNLSATFNGGDGRQRPRPM